MDDPKHNVVKRLLKKIIRRPLLWYFMIPVMVLRLLRNYILINTGKVYTGGMPPDKYRIDPAYEDVPFVKLYEQIKTHTLVDRFRCHILYQLVRAVQGAPGDVAELGVYKGGTAKLICTVLGATKKTVHLFDTFEGMPETRPDRDIHKKGDFADTDLSMVREYIGPTENAVFHVGYFPETAAGLEDERFSLVHIDADIYQSVYDACSFFYPRLIHGGYMVFDDYGQRSCPGAKLAVDTFFTDKVETPLWLTSGQCLIVKLAKHISA